MSDIAQGSPRRYKRRCSAPRTGSPGRSCMPSAFGAGGSAASSSMSARASLGGTSSWYATGNAVANRSISASATSPARLATSSSRNWSAHVRSADVILCSIRSTLIVTDTPGVVRTSVVRRARADSEIWTWVSRSTPDSSSTNMRSMRSRACVLYRSRGTYSRHEKNRSYGSRRAKRRTRRRSYRFTMPRIVRTSSGTLAWNSSSRGCVSSTCISALPSWLTAETPKRSITRCTLCRSSGISRGLVLYVLEVKRPMKRFSPITRPRESNDLMPM